jgi:hypothetical protein
MQGISEIVGTSTAIIRLNLSNAKLADDALLFLTSSLAKTTSLMTFVCYGFTKILHTIN